MTMVTAAIIAGGKSSRMGADKAFLELDGQPMWRRQADILRDAGATEILVSANSAQDFPGMTVVRDAVSESGPLGGLAACLRHCRHGLLLAIAVDMPNLSADFLRPLLGRRQPLVFREPDSRFFEPFPGVYPQSAAAVAERRLREGALSLQDFIREIDPEVRTIRPDERHYFENWNTPAEVRP